MPSRCCLVSSISCRICRPLVAETCPAHLAQSSSWRLCAKQSVRSDIGTASDFCQVNAVIGGKIQFQNSNFTKYKRLAVLPGQQGITQAAPSLPSYPPPTFRTSKIPASRTRVHACRPVSTNACLYLTAHCPLAPVCAYSLSSA